MQQQVVCRAHHQHHHHASRRAPSSSSRGAAAPMHSKQLQRAMSNTALRQRLGQSLAVNDHVVGSVLAACPNLVQQQQLVAANLELLHSLSSSAQAVRRLVLSTPHVLTTPMHAWQEFLAAYGLQERQIWRMLASQPRLLLQGSIYGAGRAIMFLRQLGWSDVEVSTLVIQHPEHCRILLLDVDSQLQPVLQHLMQEQGMSQHEAAAFLRSNPAVLHSADFQQQVQQRLRRQQMQLLALV